MINVFRLANRLQNFVAPDQPVYALYLLHSLTAPLQGVGNAVVYCWTPRVRQLYAYRFPVVARLLLRLRSSSGDGGAPKLADREGGGGVLRLAWSRESGGT